MINPITGWVGIVKVQMYDLNEVMVSNYEYINKLSYRASQLFNNTWISRYPHPHKVVFDRGSEFK